MVKVKTNILFILILLIASITFIYAFWANKVLVNATDEQSTVTVGGFELPKDISNISVIAIEGGRNHSVALDIDGNLWSWGLNDYGQLGLGELTRDNKSIPNRIYVADNTKFSSISVGEQHNLAIDTDGYLWGWGYNGSYGLLGGTSIVHTPIKIAIDGESEHKFISIAASVRHNLAVDSKGQLWSWGSNDNRQLGVNDSSDSIKTPTPIPIIDAIRNVEFMYVGAGQYSSFAIDKQGNIFAWGLNTNAQLGDGTTARKYTPTPIANPDGAIYTKVVAGKYHGVALDDAGRIWSWGYNSKGQLGNGFQNQTPSPMLIPDTPYFTNINFIDISASFLSDFTMALDDEKTLWVWGDNESGQLGNGTNENQSSVYRTHLPLPNKWTLNDKEIEIVAIGAGGYYCLTIDTFGKMWSWGGNDRNSNATMFDQLGLGPTITALVLTPTLTQFVMNIIKS